MRDDLRPHACCHIACVSPSLRTFSSAARLVSNRPSCKPTTMNVWAAYRGEAALYTRHPTCGYEWNLVQSSAELHRL
ncbi:hypothetical protein [Burkholderia sp. USMB20]|uniref:hypothetical protein n=1 Tax=Burkholderia sp. USMB20 TaxID=1571773 RepID=UPI001092BAB5|nr:hypothetical protein [Burkholderia sp. USMB20]TGN93845.1 hypothetical protein PL79_035540 [Burkholderia sp. USMB20]